MLLALGPCHNQPIFPFQLELTINATEDCERPLVEEPIATVRRPPEPGPRPVPSAAPSGSDLTQVESLEVPFASVPPSSPPHARSEACDTFPF